MEKIKGYAKHKNGKTHPIHEKNGIKESDLNISVKGNNDTISVNTNKKRRGTQPTIIGLIEKKKVEGLMKQIAEDWDKLSSKEKQEKFEDWMLYKQNSMNEDNEENWIRYNYGDIEFNKLPENFKRFTIGSPYKNGMNVMVISPKYGKRYFKKINDALLFGHEENLEVLPIK